MADGPDNQVNGMLQNLPPPADRRVYPIGDTPSIILSVESSYFLPDGIYKQDLSLYCESLALSGTLRAEGTKTQPNLQICTNSVAVASHGVTLDFHGVDGRDGEAPKDGGSKELNATDAVTPGGNVSLVIESIDNAETAELIKINVAGGKGGSGSNLKTELSGGKGCNGSNGGTASIAIGNNILKLAYSCGELLNEIGAGTVTDDNISSFIKRIGGLMGELQNETLRDGRTKLTTALPTLPTLLNNLKSVIDSSPESPGTELQMPLVQISMVLTAYSDNVKTAISTNINFLGGSAGSGGQGKSTQGPNGTPGKPGSWSTIDLYDNSTLRSSTVLPAHPDHCLMLLEKAKTQYFVGDKNGLTTCAAYLQRLLTRLAFVRDLKETDSLWKAYKDAETRMFIVSNPTSSSKPASIALLEDVWNAASGYWKQLVELQMDFYGNPLFYVPRGSFDQYKKILATVLDNLTDIEATYAEFATAGSDEAKKRNLISSMVNKCESVISRAQEEIKTLSLQMESASLRIATLQDAMKNEKNKLDSAISNVEEAIKSVQVGGISFTSVMEAMGQICFTHGDPFMIGVQAASLVHEAATTIPDDHGDKINRKLLVKQINSFDPTATGLLQAYERLDNGKLMPDDINAGKLIANQQKLIALINNYHDALGSQLLKPVQDSFKSYIDVVLARNEAILDYNTCVVLWFQNSQNIKHSTAQAAKLTDEALSNLNTNLPGLALFMEKTYAEAVQGVLRILYRAQRSYQFWALTHDDPIAETLTGQPFSRLNTSLLKVTMNRLLSDFANAIEDMRTGPQNFAGTRVLLTPAQFIFFGKGKPIIVKLPAATPHSTIKDNEFAGKCNVRLTKVRFFVTGPDASEVTSNGKLQVNIKHMGSEVFYTPSYREFQFSHSAVDILFVYNTADNSYKGPGCVDGDIGSKTEEMFANVGPFTMWQIRVDPALNMGLNLSKVTGAYLEFDGKFQAFPK